MESRSKRDSNPYIKFLKNFGTPEGVLSAFLFVTVLTQALFAFVRVHFFPLSFFSAWHSFNFFDYTDSIIGEMVNCFVLVF